MSIGGYDMKKIIKKWNLLFTPRDLLNYILQNCGYVSEEEKRDIMKSLDSFECNEEDFIDVEYIFKKAATLK
jgi:hypothetical protein